MLGALPAQVVGEAFVELVVGREVRRGVDVVVRRRSVGVPELREAPHDPYSLGVQELTCAIRIH
ncbi:MAG: hypothetical protein M3217_08710 [Actinomycetota bacterium]|nr:hypothetical protein [Actinomycetota bacterium]